MPALAHRLQLFGVVLLAIWVGGCAEESLPTEPSPTGCAYISSATNRAFDASGGAGTISVWAPASCVWTATATASWITIEDSDEHQGDGSVGFLVDRNCDRHERVGAIVIDRRVVGVVQSAGPGCGLIPIPLPTRK